MLQFAFPPTQNIKFAFPPTQNPNASQCNIGCVGSLALGLCVGHVHFIFFVLISFALGIADANAVFSGIWALLKQSANVLCGGQSVTAAVVLCTEHITIAQKA